MMFGKHWGYNVHPVYKDWANIYCPTLTDNRVDGFSDMRAIYRELKALESILKDLGFKGWVLWTHLVNTHIMKILTKLKSVPFGIDLKQETIWFKKEL